MAWIIRNAAGQICGRFTNKPGPGNKMPDGSDEVPIYVEEDPVEPGYDAAALEEVSAFDNRPASQPESETDKLLRLLRDPVEGPKIRAELAR